MSVAWCWSTARRPRRKKSLTSAAAVSRKTAVTVCHWDDAALREVMRQVDLIVNATPIGMKDGDAPLLDPAWIDRSHSVMDMVYRSGSATPLIAAAQSKGAKTADGLPLLLHQGAISFAHWFGEPVPLEEMRDGFDGLAPF